MIYGSVCSGIEAATVAWHTLGWRAAFYSEIERFPRAVLTHHYPNIPLHGDFTTIEAGQYEPIDLLVGGTPCQDFSVAGLRAGLDGERGNLTLEYARLAQRLRPRWLVWENVPGVFSNNGGRDFGAVLACFAGYPSGLTFEPPRGGWQNAGIVPSIGPHCHGLAWRVFDAQFTGVPQRRRRVFIVGYLGDWRVAAAVLFERHSLSGNPPPRREAGKAVAPTISARAKGGGGLGTDFDCDGGLIAGTLNANGKAAGSATQQDAETGMLVTHSLRADGFDASEDGTGRGTPLVPVAFNWQNAGNDGLAITTDATGPLDCSQTKAIAFNMHKSGNDGSSLGVSEDRVDCLRAFEKAPFAVQPSQSMAVRRLTPAECESLQGFPRGFTLIPMRGARGQSRWRRIGDDEVAYLRGLGAEVSQRGRAARWYTTAAADGPRYKALGNSMAVPCMRWIGHRIDRVNRAILAAERIPA